MLIYEKKVEEERHLFGTFGTIPSEEDSQLEYEGFEPSISGTYFDNGKGGIKDAEGNELTVTLDGVTVVPQGGEAPIPPVPTPVVPIEEAGEEAQEFSAHFASDVYNKKGSNKTLNRENDEDVANFYYVAVAENVEEDAVVYIGANAIEEDAKLKLSVGNNSFVEDNYYFIEDGALFVAFPVMLLEGVAVEDTVVFDAGSTDELVVTGAKVVGEGSIEEEEENKWYALIEKRNSYLDFGLEDVEANDIIISKKIRDGALSYGFIKADEEVDGVPAIGYYPFLWAKDEAAWEAQADITVTEYTLYSPTLNKKTTFEAKSFKGDAIPHDGE